jgi:hypothetical protein
MIKDKASKGGSAGASPYQREARPTSDCRIATLRESSHGPLSLARTAAMAGRTNRYKFLALFPPFLCYRRN